MLISEVAKLTPMERFAYWITERHSIHLRRTEQKKKAPWTDDEVLQSYFFTNPFRENDKVTQWFRTNVRDPLKESEDVLFATICFRWFNYIPTGVALCNYRTRGGYQFDYGLLEDWRLKPALIVLEQCSQNGQVFTGAFNISNSGSTKPKINRVCEDYIQPVWEDVENLVSNADTWESLEEAHTFITEYPGLGGSGFMAYEVVSDLRYTCWLRGASDILTWANPGPGAKRGYNRLRDYPLEARVTKSEYNIGANEVREELICLLKKQNKYDKLPVIDARTIEHSLCEFDKYERARLGDGHMKRTYPGKG